MNNYFVVDTNVLVIANDLSTSHAPLCCIQASIAFLNSLKDNGHLIIDDNYEIIREYQNNVNATDQPRVGDVFLKWVLRNLANPVRCTQVHIRPNPDREYEDFPDDPELASFDRSDRKFVAVALVHPEHPLIANATDSDWGHATEALNRHGVQVHQLCS